MAELLNDQEIRQILGTVIRDGDESSVRPNHNTAQDGISGQVRQVVREEMPAMQDRWLVLTGTGLLALTGIGISVFSSQFVLRLLMRHGIWIGLLLTIVTAGIFFWRLRRKKPEKLGS